MKKRVAIIDLGTNTFHLMIIEFESAILSNSTVLFKESIPAKIGQGGINKGVITPEAIERALVVLRKFRATINTFAVDSVFATGTSAIRNASNQADFIAIVLAETNIQIEVISGEREAELIYKGVKEALKIGQEPAMIIDIGGGSVEFIICNETKIFWKQSFEIGGQRLIELFMKTDPISPAAVSRMNDYFTEKLLPLSNACHQYAPLKLIGSSGSFDTLLDMHFMAVSNALPPAELTASPYPISAFYAAYEALLLKNKEERMAIPGMIELRVEMIVVAVCLVRYIIQTFGIQEIEVSHFALKEGVFSEIFNQ